MNIRVGQGYDIHKLIICQNISKILDISIDSVSVKAKTKEKLDSTGQGLAVEVFSVVLIGNDSNRSG